MGSIKKLRKSYAGPNHPWQRLRMEHENELRRKYGLRTKREIWKAQAILRRNMHQAKRLVAESGEQIDREQKQFLKKLNKYGWLPESGALSDVLNLQINDVLDRRLQTVVWRKNLTQSIYQARQCIVHGHIHIGEKKMDVPSHLVTVAEEEQIRFSPQATFAAKLRPAPKDSKEDVKKKLKETSEDKKVRSSAKKAVRKEVKAKENETKKIPAKDTGK